MTGESLTPGSHSVSALQRFPFAPEIYTVRVQWESSMFSISPTPSPHYNSIHTLECLPVTNHSIAPRMIPASATILSMLNVQFLGRVHWVSLEPRLSVPDFVSQLRKIRNGKPGFEASIEWEIYFVNIEIYTMWFPCTSQVYINWLLATACVPCSVLAIVTTNQPLCS